MKYKKLITFTNAKTVKGEKSNWLTGILYMAPANMVKGINVCKFASKGCKQSCLYSAGRGKFSNVQQARISKTELFRDDQEHFMQCIVKDIERAIKRADKLGMLLAIRLNGTSDISYEDILINGKNIFETFPQVTFYDYTKNYKRVNALMGEWSNYHLTFSRSESKVNQREANKLINQGVNVAVVFNTLPNKYNGVQVIDGDKDDLRFLDKKNRVVGLVAKGDAKKDNSGFVVKN